MRARIAIAMSLLLTVLVAAEAWPGAPAGATSKVRRQPSATTTTTAAPTTTTTAAPTTTTTAAPTTTTTAAPTTTTTAAPSTTTTAAPTTTTTAPTGTTSPYRGRVGISSHLFWLSSSDAQVEMQRISAGGVDWIREDLLWGQLEPQRGSFVWTKADNLMTAAAMTRMHVLGILDYSAPWASSDPTGQGNTQYPPSNPSDYATFAAAVVARYGPAGTFWTANPQLTPMPLTAVELWNEPFGSWDWLPNPNPTAYAALVRAAAAAIRSANRGVSILASGDVLQSRTDGTIVTWLDTLLTVDPGLGTVIDGWTVHPYPDPKDLGPYDTTQNVDWEYARVAVSYQVAANHGAVKPLWITEIGWSTATGTPDGVSEATQATYEHDALVRAVQEWGAYVARTFVYSWDLSTGTAGDVEGNYGLRRADNTLKPAWTAIQGLIANGT